MSNGTQQTGPPDDLVATISDRLSGSELGEVERGLVRAALHGEDAIRRELDSSGTFPQSASAKTDQGQREEVFLKSISVSGFRGIGPRSTLELDARPGLTIVEGPNGSGKSSFAEALELLLTGNIARLENRTGHWLRGWPNVHQSSGAELEAELVVSGSATPHVVHGGWPDGAILAGPRSDFVMAGSQQLGGVQEQGWARAMSMWRPFLAPANLAQLAEEPSAFFDVMYEALGLTALTKAEDGLSKVKSGISKERKALPRDLQALLRELEDSQDSRARACHAALSTAEWDLDRVDAILRGNDPDESDELANLRSLAALMVPDEDEVSGVARRLREASEQAARFEEGETRRKLAVKRMIEEVLNLHEPHEDALCPVCHGRRLDAQWRQEASAEVERLALETANAEQAVDALKSAKSNLEELVKPLPPALSDKATQGVDPSSVAGMWRSWEAVLEARSAVEQADQLERTYAPLSNAVSALKEEAESRLDQLNRSWRPLAQKISTWLDRARRDERAAISEQRLSRAEDWVKRVSGDLATSARGGTKRGNSSPTRARMMEVLPH